MILFSLVCFGFVVLVNERFKLLGVCKRYADLTGQPGSDDHCCSHSEGIEPTCDVYQFLSSCEELPYMSSPSCNQWLKKEQRES